MLKILISTAAAGAVMAFALSGSAGAAERTARGVQVETGKTDLSAQRRARRGHARGYRGYARGYRGARYRWAGRGYRYRYGPRYRYRWAGPGYRYYPYRYSYPRRYYYSGYPYRYYRPYYYRPYYRPYVYASPFPFFFSFGW